MSGALEYAAWVRIEWVDVSRSAESVGSRGRIGECPDSSGTVGSADTGGAALEFIDGDGEGSTEHRGVISDLMDETEFGAAALW